MKKIRHTIILLFLTSIAFSQEQKEEGNTTIKTMSTFGRLGADCGGRGICSFSETTSKILANSVVVLNEDNTITLIIDRAKITNQEAYKIIGERLNEYSKNEDLTFVMEESLELNSDLKFRLQTPLSFTKILKGNYPIATTKKSFIITLKME